MTPIEGKVPTRLAFFHGLGSMAYGVKDNGFATFLLLYYNQVLGMDAKLVSFALLLALVLDAFIDPIVGHLSDRTYTRWGRRLPWLYIAPIPLALVWYALWTPGEPGFWSLVLLAMLVRMLVSACEVPSVALVPELTRDYDERTRLMRFRFLFGWAGGLLMLFLAYDVFLAGGMLSAEGYQMYGLFGAILMATAVIVSAIGQHRYAAGLPATRPERFGIRSGFSEIIESLRHPAFLILLAGGAVAYTSQGITFSITNYLMLFIWKFDSAAFAVYPFVLMASVVTIFFLLGPFHRRWGKRETAVAGAVIGMLFWVTPFFLRGVDAWFVEGTAASDWALFGFFFFANVFSVGAMISASSMLADVVEASEEQTGRRTEATFFAGNFFMQKCATGLGIFATGLLVDLAGIPEQTTPETVPADAVDRLSSSYAILVFIMAIAVAMILRRFPITRSDHEARVKMLSKAALSEPDASGLHR